jgi:hypothetical protein
VHAVGVAVWRECARIGIAISMGAGWWVRGMRAETERAALGSAALFRSTRYLEARDVAYGIIGVGDVLGGDIDDRRNVRESVASLSFFWRVLSRYQ